MAPSALDLDPLYCAEQIVIPKDLADILKAFTKEVIRAQPEDLLGFSAEYFMNLAAASSPVLPPTLEQLRAVNEMVANTGLVQLEELVSMCNSAGIAAGTLDQIVKLGEFGGMVDPRELLVLLLSTTNDSVMGVVNGLFSVFGREEKLDVATFLALFGFIAQRDTSIAPEAMEGLTAALNAIEAPDIGFGDVASLPEIAALAIAAQGGEPEPTAEDA